MFARTLVDKENIQGEILVTTPGRKPLKTVQMVAGNAGTEGTPSSFVRKTPRQRLSSVTPSSKKLSRRKSKRQSVPLRLSKAYSVFEEETASRITGTSASLTLDKLPNFKEDCLIGWKQGQTLNEMLREKVFETVSKMREKYESCIAEKEKNLSEQTGIIGQLKAELNTLKQDQEHHQRKGCNKMTEESENLCEDEQVSLLVEEVIFKAVKDLESDKSLSFSCSKQTNSVTVLATPVRLASSETSMSPAKKTDSGTSMNLVRQASSETSMTPVNQVCSSPAEQISCKTVITQLRKTDCGTSMTPTKVHPERSRTPVGVANNETSMTPLKQTNSETCITPTSQTDSQTSMTPVRQVDSATSVTLIQQANSETSFTPTKQTDSATSVTPLEQTNQNTMVSPIKTFNVGQITSPLVAALHPEIINGLPIENLKSELESAAISNELLRCECDELNGKVEDLESLLKDVRNSAGKECSFLQERILCLQKELHEALEINYQMESKKPHSVEEYEDVIKKLNKDLLLKEKQITFYVKKASEADNLQKDLRRMYAKYNAEHQSYTALDKKMNDLIEEHNVKCSEFEAMQKELNDHIEELGQAKATIDVQDKIREEAKKNQVKCCALEEQIEAFQSNEKENLEFMEQERRGLEETTVELEQLVKGRTAELEATRQALEIKTEQHEHLRETVHSLRTQLAEVEDELNAVQSQAHLVMLEQEKELTTVSRVLETAWERLTTMVHKAKEENKLPKEEKDYKPSLVWSILKAVSSAATPANAKDSAAVNEQEEQQRSPVVVNSPREARHDSPDFTSVDRAISINELLAELEDHTRGQAANEKVQMIIQEHQDKIASLEEVLEERRQQYEKRIEILKRDLEHGKDSVKKTERENHNKQQEIENLKVQLHTTQQSFQASQDRMRELGDRYCQLIEKETENEDIKENIRILERECEKLKMENSTLKKDLNETMERLGRAVDTIDVKDLVTKKTTIKESFTELFQEKLRLQKEVSKLRDYFAKSRSEKESFTQYNAELETKVNVLASNLIKAEEEIYRLDGIIDRFCSVAQQNKEITIQCKDLCDLLRELNITIRMD